MSEIERHAKRPTAITVICGIGFVGAVVTVPLIFSSIAQQIGAWYPPYLAISAVIGVICMVGLWMMKKWAAYLYTGAAALHQIVMVAMGIWNIMATLIPAVIIFFVLRHRAKMT